MKKSMSVLALVAFFSAGAVWADSGASWTFTLNEGGDNKKGVLASGNWKLNAELKTVNSDILCLCKNAYIEGSGILDLSLPISQGDKNLVLKEVITYASYNLPNTISVKRIVLPETIANIGAYAFANHSSISKLIVRSTNIVELTQRAFFQMTNMRRMDLALPNVTAAGTASQVLSNGKYVTLCFDATGYGDIPAGMLGGPVVTNLVLKTASGQKFTAKAFTTREIQRVCLTGDCPDLSASAVEPRKDNCIFGDQWLNKGKVLFCVPYGNATYDAWREAATELTDDELATFRERYPNDPAPLGWISGSLCGTYYDQYLCEFNPLAWDDSLVISAEGEYAHLFTDARTIYGLDDGETLTLAPSPWVVDGVRYAVTGGKIERPLGNATGWSSEEFSGTSYTFEQKGEEGARLTWKIEKLYQKPTIVTDYSPYSESVTATPDKDPVEEGFYPAGTKWTLTVKDLKTAIPQSHFVRWVGDVPAGHETDMPLVITPTNGAISIRAEFLHDWVYKAYDGESGGNMIYDGVWKLRASANKNNQVTIGGTWTYGCGFLEGPSSPTPLDLSGAITDADGNTNYLYSIKNPAFRAISNISSIRIVSDTLEELGAETFREMPDLAEIYFDIPNCKSINYSCFMKNASLTNVVLKADSLTGFGMDVKNRAYTFSEDANLVRAVLYVPQVKALPYYFMFKCPLTDADFSTWNVSSVEELGEGAFQQMKNAGTLSFPSAKNVGVSCFDASSIKNLTLGSDKTLTNIANTAFNWCSGLKTLTLGNARGLQVAKTAFTNMAPTSVTFLGPAPSTEAIDNILDRVAATTGAKNCTIYASFKFDGWGTLAAELTEEEKTAASQAGISPRGVYREGSRKAWFINKKSPYDPMGLLIFLR